MNMNHDPARGSVTRGARHHVPHVLAPLLAAAVFAIALATVTAAPASAAGRIGDPFATCQYGGIDLTPQVVSSSWEPETFGAYYEVEYWDPANRKWFHYYDKRVYVETGKGLSIPVWADTTIPYTSRYYRLRNVFLFWKAWDGTWDWWATGLDYDGELIPHLRNTSDSAKYCTT